MHTSSPPPYYSQDEHDVQYHTPKKELEPEFHLKKSYTEQSHLFSSTPFNSSMPPVPPTPSPSTSHVLYSDPKYGVTVNGSTRTLIVKGFMSFKSTRKIPISQILFIRHAREVVTRIAYKDWGISIMGINWAMDRHRQCACFGHAKGEKAIDRSLVYKAEGDTFRSGFSTADPEGLMRALEMVVKGVTTRDETCGDKMDHRHGEIVYEG
jgi:hypothetical protein